MGIKRIIVRGFLSDLHCDASKDKDSWDHAFINQCLIDELSSLRELVLKEGDKTAGAHVALLQLMTHVICISRGLNIALKKHQGYTASVLSRTLFESLAYMYFCLKSSDKHRINWALNAYLYSGYRSWISIKKYSAEDDVFHFYDDSPIFSVQSQLDINEAEALNKYRDEYKDVLYNLRQYDVPDANESIWGKCLDYTRVNGDDFIEVFNIDRCKFYSIPLKKTIKGKDRWVLADSFTDLVNILKWNSRYFYVYLRGNDAIHSNYSLFSSSWDDIKRGDLNESYDVLSSQILTDMLCLCVLHCSFLGDDFNKHVLSFFTLFDGHSVALFDDTESELNEFIKEAN